MKAAKKFKKNKAAPKIVNRSETQTVLVIRSWNKKIFSLIKKLKDIKIKQAFYYVIKQAFYYVIKHVKN